MVDLDIYKKVFDTYDFEIHECFETGKLGKLKGLAETIHKTLPESYIKYTTNLGYVIYCKVDINST